MGRHFRGRNIQSIPLEAEVIHQSQPLVSLGQVQGIVVDAHIHSVAALAIPDIAGGVAAAGSYIPWMEFPLDPIH